MSDYQRFLSEKNATTAPVGLAEIPPLSPSLFPFQRDIVEWALKVGRAAIFADCGMGKTLMQLEWARCVPARVLILAPLAVACQTAMEAAKFGIEAKHLRDDDGQTKIVVTNYERFVGGHFDLSRFGAIVLDESSILKSYTGKTKRLLIELCQTMRYRLCCTATPAPNDHIELGNHSQFLGVMESTDMLSRWFINDSMQAGNYRIKKHAEADFWRWVSTWAVALRKPSDVRAHYSDEQTNLPPLRFIHHEVKVPERAQDLGLLFLDRNLSATEIWDDKANTAEKRCARAAEIVATKTDVPWVVWCDTNDESSRLAKLIPGAVEIRGDISVEQKETRLTDFAEGRTRIVISKADVTGFGMNWQHCADVVFVGLTYSYEKVYQSLRRTWRFGQKKEVVAHMINVESEGGMAEALERKAQAHETMMTQLVESTRTYGVGIASYEKERKRVEVKRVTGERYELYNGDCVEVAAMLPNDSVDLSVFSPPFSNLYIYSDSAADMGNSADHPEFFAHFGYLIKDMLRITKPGRLACVHCKDLPLYMNRDGAAGLYDFPGEIVREFEKHGWTFHSRVTIWKDPVTEMQRTKNHGLLHKNFSQRREVVRQGMADYVLVFRAWKGEIPDKQVDHPAVPGDYIGDKAPDSWKNQRDYSIQVWQRYASPVWFDINQPCVLSYREARDDKDEKHICPLQLEVIERCVWLWSNPGDTVFSPFAGIGSEGFVSIGGRVSPKRAPLEPRRFVGIELKPSYFEQAKKNLDAAEKKTETESDNLFAAIEQNEEN